MIRNKPLRIGSSGGNQVLLPALRNRGGVETATYKSRERVTAGVQVSGPMGGGGTAMGAAPGGGGGASGRSQPIKVGGVDMTTPYIDNIPHVMRCAMYKDIYLHDNVGGPVVDIMSNIPFGQFRLNVNVRKDRGKIQDTYEETLSRLRMGSMLPSIGKEVLVYGGFASMLLYDTSKRIFTDSMPFPYSACNVQPNILYGHDPLISVTLPSGLKAFLDSRSPTAEATLKRINPALKELLRERELELEPKSTLFVGRPGFADEAAGCSLYSRILPLYFLEKVLYRGTVTIANRRQSAVQVITAGDDEWEPTKSELDDLVANYIGADRDPIGAVFATRNGVSISEAKSGGEFWRYDQIMDDMVPRKLTSMGASEAFLSGDATVGNADAAVNGMMDQMDAFRNSTVRSVFYDKIFPAIADVNDYTWDRFGRDEDNRLTASFGGKAGNETPYYRSGLNMASRDSSSLIIPELVFTRRLNNNSGADPMDVMDKLTQRGVPFTIRAWAAAAGYDLDELFSQAEGSEDDLKKMSKIQKLLAANGGQQQQNGDGTPQNDNDYNGEDMFNQESASISHAMQRRMLPNLKIGDRNYRDRDYEFASVTPTGKRHYRPNQERLHRQANEVVAAVLRNRREEETGVKFYYQGRKARRI